MSRPITCFFFPHAGGNKHSYLPLKAEFPKFINFVPFELPGRGTRINEDLFNSIGLLIDNIYSTLSDSFRPPYTLGGHSLGSIITYLLALKIWENKKPMPLHLFVSGRGGPSCKYDNELCRYNSTQPRVELFSNLFQLGGIPVDIAENEDFLSFLEPIFRADLKLLEDYQYKACPRLDVPITVLLGKSDRTTQAEAELWADETLQECCIEYFDGGHFFIFDQPAQVATLISRRIMSTNVAF